MRRLVIAALLLVALVPAARAATTEPAPQPRFSVDELERELMCPTCKSPLYLSTSPAADRIRAFIAQKRDEGWTKQQVKDRLVADFGESILAAPKREGFGLAAWVVPIVAILGGLAVAVGLALVWRRRSRDARPGGETTAALPDDLEARVDDALARFE